MLSEAIFTQQLSRRYRDIVAVNQVTLQVPQSSIYGFLGPNGAGKTTTIRLLLQLIRPDAGVVRVLGLTLPKQRQAILRQVGTLVEMPSLYPHLTGYENLDITRRLLGKERRQIDHVLGIVRLESAARRLVRDYSLGMRQRLALALALLGDPALLILDEPTNGLDPAGIQEMRALLKTLAVERGITVFLSSHLLSEVEQIATHIGILAHGKLVFQGTLEALRALSTPHIRVQVDHPDQARQLFAQRGYAVETDADGILRVTNGAAFNAAAINALLVQNQIAVSHLSYVVPSLEDLFTQLTGKASDS